MLITEFLDLGIEEKSLYIRALFEQAAEHCAASQDDYPYLAIQDKKAYLTVDNNDKAILTTYNETLFPNDKFIEMGDDCCMIPVSREILNRYCSANVLGTVPDIDTLDTENAWRSEAAIMDSRGPEPLIVFRGLTCPQSTASHYYCDAQAVISQQLMNYQQVFKTRGILGRDLFQHLSFPAVEGRGAVFCFAGVPFHAYNARTYNELLGQHLGLFKCDYDAYYWQINESVVGEKGFVISELKAGEGVSLLPGISSLQANRQYSFVLRLPLTQYIAHNLDYQKSLAIENRIVDQDGQRASSDKIEQALALLNTILAARERSIQALRRKSDLFSAANEDEDNLEKPGFCPVM